MHAATRNSLFLGAFLVAVGLLFTLTAPGGLGEVTLVAGVAVILAAFAPAGIIRRFGTRRALIAAVALIVVGAALTAFDWSDVAPTWTKIAGGAFFLFGVVALTLHATAPKPAAPKSAAPKATDRR